MARSCHDRPDPPGSGQTKTDRDSSKPTKTTARPRDSRCCWLVFAWFETLLPLHSQTIDGFAPYHLSPVAEKVDGEGRSEFPTTGHCPCGSRAPEFDECCGPNPTGTVSRRAHPRRAQQQADRIEAWWVDHRPAAPTLFTDELEPGATASRRDRQLESSLWSASGPRARPRNSCS